MGLAVKQPKPLMCSGVRVFIKFLISKKGTRDAKKGRGTIATNENPAFIKDKGTGRPTDKERNWVEGRKKGRRTIATNETTAFIIISSLLFLFFKNWVEGRKKGRWTNTPHKTPALILKTFLFAPLPSAGIPESTLRSSPLFLSLRLSPNSSCLKSLTN